MSSTPVEVAPLPVSQARTRSRWAAPTTAVGRANERLGWMLVLPSVLVVIGVAIYPLFETFRLSFTNTRLGSVREPRYVGFENYRDLLTDDLYINAFRNTVLFTIASVSLEVILGMVVALVVHSAFTGRGLVRTSMLVPWAIPTVVSAILWDWMFHPTYGAINSVLIRLNLMDASDTFSWTASTATALGVVVAIDVWKTIPFMALLLLAGLQVIPGDVYEASYVDGASKWQQFWQITLPLLRPALLVALIFRTLDAFRIFDMIYVLKGYSTETMSLAVYIQQKIVSLQRLGEGSAAAVILFLAIFVLVIVYTRLIRVEEG